MVASTNGQSSPLGGIISFGVNSGPVFRCLVLDCPAALRAFRSPFGEMISFGVILGPCVVSDCPAALRAGRNLVLAQSSFVVGPSRPRHVSRLKVWSESSCLVGLAQRSFVVGHSRPRHVLRIKVWSESGFGAKEFCRGSLPPLAHLSPLG